MAEPISTDIAQTQEPLNTDTGSAFAPPSMETAQVRAAKAAYGLQGIIDYDYPTLVRNIISGNEDKIRDEAASKIAAIKTRQTYSNITSLMASGAKDASMLSDVLRQNTSYIDPRSVVEEGFSQKLLDTLNWVNPQAPAKDMDDALESPLDKIADQSRGMAQAATAQREYALKRYSEAQDLSDRRGYTSYFLDKGLTFIQLYDEIRQRGNTGHYFGGLGLGEEKAAQYDELLNMPFDKYKDTLDATFERLKGNPDELLRYLDGLIAPTTMKRRTDDLMTVMAIPEIGTVLKGATGLARGVYFRNQLNRAIRSQIQAATEAAPTRPPEVVASATAGDLKTAAVNQAVQDAQELVKGVQSTPIRESLDSMMEGFKDQIKAIDADHGNMGQEGVNRMKEDTQAFMLNLMKGITNVLKVERIPGFLASKEAMSAYYESIKNLYPGFRNSIVNMGSKIEWDPVTNTYHVPITFGNGAEAFTNSQTAFNKALHEGLVPAEESLLSQVNRHFGDESGKLFKQLDDLKAELRQPSGPSKEEVDLEGIRTSIKEVQKKIDDLQAWHADKLTEPGIKDIMIKGSGEGFRVVQEGNGYFIKMYKPVDETSQLIRDSLLNKEVKSKWNNLELEDHTTPHNFWKDMFGWVRTPEETLSAMHSANRKIAAYAPSVFQRVLRENAAYLESLYSGVNKIDPLTGEKYEWIRDTYNPLKVAQARVQALLGGTYLTPTRSMLLDTSLGKKLFANGTRWNRFVRFLDHGRKLMDDTLDDNGLPQTGYFFKSPGEFERHYTKIFGVSPQPLETAAYFAFRRQYEADKVFRELVLFKNASRLGAEEHSIYFTTPNGEKVNSPFFSGIRMDHLPGGDDNLAVFHNNGLQWLGKANEQDINTAAKRREDVKQGKLKVIRIFAADQRPLNGFSTIEDQKIHYVVVPTSPETRPLSFGNMLPRRGGGHIVYDYDNYIKQAMVRPDKVGERFQHWYEGDATIMPIKNRAMGARIAGHLDQVRKYLKDEDVDNARRYAAANLPMEWDEIHSWFRPNKTPDGRVLPARLGLDEPIQVVPRNKNISDIDNKLASRYPGTFKDSTRGSSPAESLKTQFAGQRDSDIMYTVNDYGTHANPLYKYEPAELVDPVTTINRSLKSISDSYFLDDYKLYAIEHWLQESWQYLDVARYEKPYEEIMKSPFYYFYNGNYKPGISLGQKSELALRRYQIKQFLGEPGKIQGFLNWASQELADAAYEDRFFQRTALRNHVSMVPSWLVQNAMAPAQKLRTAAYHAIIGTFNVAQLLAQSMNYVTMAGLAGQKALPGSIAAMLHQYARLLGPSDEMLDHLDRIAVNLGLYKPGEWKEAFHALSSTGYDIVGAEHMMLEKIYTPKVVTNGFQKFLDAGDIFFKGAERNARFGAWYIAHKEFRADNPVGKLANLDVAKILDRADYLSGNMSRASRSLLQTGIGEFPTQFLGYTMRVAEQFTGSRIGWKARARLATAFALMYGFPQSSSLTGFPADKYLRQYAMSRGYVVGDNFWKDFAMQGMPSMILALVSGAGDWKHGTQINFGQRYGSPGLDIIRDALNGDKALLKIFAGASGSFYQSTIDTTHGFRRAMYAMINGDSDEFKLKPIDLLQPLTITSAGNYLTRSMVAINRAKWISKNGTNLAEGGGQDISPLMSAIMGFTGTQPQQVADLDLTSANHKADLDLQRDAEKRFTIEWNRGIRAMLDNDPDNATDFLKRANIELIDADYPPEKKPQLMKRVMEEHDQSLMSRLDKLYDKMNPPPKERDTRADQYKTKKDIEEYKAWPR